MCIIRKYRKYLIMLAIISVMICIRMLSTYAYIEAGFREVKYTIPGPITANTYFYDISLDALKYHISASSYDAKIGEITNDNFLEMDVGASSSLKAKGYGYYLYKLNSLKGFIEFCYSQNPELTENNANIVGATDNDSCNYMKLLNLSASTLSNSSKAFMTQFWNRMYDDANLFESYQDSYFFKENTLKAIQKIKSTLSSVGLEANNLSEKNLSNNRTSFPYQSSKEYLTLLTTYMYSINREEKLASVGKGDLVPFLYYAEHTDETDPYVIGKYAYVALVYEFLKVAGKNYWSQEFESLYFADGEGYVNSEIFEEYDIETLEEWYDETYEKYKNDRGTKQNPLIGSDIDTIISSDYSINFQVEATKNHVESIYAELGIDMTVNDFIARNALMAEYMMQDSRLDDTIKDYNVSIKFVKDNLQRGTFEDRNGTTAVLSDFQTIDFGDTIKKVANKDKDGDGLTNKAELGNVKWQDITVAVEAMYQSKYGTNMSLYETKVDEIVKNNGGYTDFNGNFVYGHVKKEKDALGKIKVYYRTYDYKSNPALKDTDFDGMDDKDDGRTKDNLFHGTTKIEKNQRLNVYYNNDFRYFYMDNNKYNDELAQMSLIISNLANDEDRKLNIYQGGDKTDIMIAGRVPIGNMNISEYLVKIGFMPLGNISLYNNDGKCYLYYKIVNYYGKEKLVFGIFIGGFDSERSYRELVASSDTENYQTIVNNIVNQVRTLKGLNTIKSYFDNNQYCYWLAGKGVGGVIASRVASELSEAKNTYCYTFGIPNINGTSNSTFVKNIVNEDDLLPKIHSGIGQDGDVYNKSVYWDLIPEYKKYVESPNKYKGNFKRTNSVSHDIEEIHNTLSADDDMTNTFKDELGTYLYRQLGDYISETESNYFNQTRLNFSDLAKIDDNILEIIQYKDEVSSGNSTKAYWCLVKSLDGYDSKYYYGNDNEVYNKTETKPPDSSKNTDDKDNYITFDTITNVLTNLAKYYINTINTHEGNNYSNRANDLANGENGASKYYKEEHGSGDKRLKEYEYDTLKKLPDIRDNDYMVKNSQIFDNTDPYNFNLRPYNTGDSCSDFAITAIRMLSGGYRGEPTDSYDKRSDEKAKNDYGLYLHNTYSLIMQGINEEQKDLEESNKSDRHGVVGSLSFERAMTRLGYEKIYVTSDMTIEDLEVGDILVSNKHTEFYTGTNFETIYIDMRNGTINNWKKSGISSITESGTNQSADNGKLYGTFGWGGVHDEFPVESSDNILGYFYKYNNESYFRHCVCGNEPDKTGTEHISSQCKFSDVDHQYKIIWRKQ